MIASANRNTFISTLNGQNALVKISATNTWYTAALNISSFNTKKYYIAEEMAITNGGSYFANCDCDKVWFVGHTYSYNDTGAGL